MPHPYLDPIAPLEYYSRPGPMTNPCEHADLYLGLPHDLDGLCRVVQSTMVHVFHLKHYGLADLPEERKAEVQLRFVARMLGRLRAMEDAPLVVARPPERRLVGNCRDHSVLLCSLLRHLGIPARARCGFATYFIPGHYEDHWVGEYWEAAARRWVLVDAQFDALHIDLYHPDFHVHDVPRDRFITGGKAWQLCRTGQADPNDFGIFDMKGLRFVCGNLIRDLAALNRMELLPWDLWGLMLKDSTEYDNDDLVALDRAADLVLAGNDSFAEMRALYHEHAGLRLPRVIQSFVGGALAEVDLGEQDPTGILAGAR